MNVYIVVEGEKTEMTVYPAWLSIIAPNMHRIDDARDLNLTVDSYYLFCGYGIPHIYKHIANSVKDINEINSKNSNAYDYLMVCLDTENENRNVIEKNIKEYLKKEGTFPKGFEIVIFEQKVCMETWFLGNRRLLKDNPNDGKMVDYLHHYNVKTNNPEEMESIDPCRWNKATFHLKYLKKMLAERNMKYDKNDTSEVCKLEYLNELIARYNETKHLLTFGAWYNFVKEKIAKKSD